MLIQNPSCPWNVPVRVEPGRFVAIAAEHRELNVQVAPTAAYASDAVQLPSESLLFADLQTSLHSHIAGRLGSGWSGFYRGWYLKGVGRTPLAANWNRNDQLHNSGHQAAGSAIREYVVSRYLRDRGCGDSIVGCEGLLLAELDPALADYHRILYGDKPADQVPEVDRHLQALTVKRGDFARQSNFTWLLHHLSPGYLDRGRASLGVFCELLTAALTPPAAQVPPDTELTPASIVALLAHSVHRACEHFRQWFTSGVWWGSLNNNFTTDGRFLDLEVPAMLGGPCLGYLATSKDDTAPERGLHSGMFGSELFYFLAHTRVFCNSLRLVLANLPSWFAAVEREFAAELASELEHRLLGPDELLGAGGKPIVVLRSLFQDAFGRLPAEDQAAIDALIDRMYSEDLGPAPGNPAQPPPRFTAVPGDLWLLTEPGARWRPFALTLPSGRRLEPSEAQRRAARQLADLVSDLDRTTSLAGLVDKLTHLSRSERVI